MADATELESLSLGLGIFLPSFLLIPNHKHRETVGMERLHQLSHAGQLIIFPLQRSRRHFDALGYFFKHLGADVYIFQSNEITKSFAFEGISGLITFLILGYKSC